MDNISLYLLLPLLVNSIRLFDVVDLVDVVDVGEVSETHNEMLGFNISPNPDNLGI